MMYVAKVKFWSDYEQGVIWKYCFVPGNSYSEAMGVMVDYYGEKTIEEISIELWAPDCFLEFDADNDTEAEMFQDVKDILGAKVIW